MKKTIIALAFVTLSFVSCTNDDSTTNDAVATTKDGVTTAKLNVAIKTNENNLTGKNVERGTLYAWIKDINISVISQDFNYTKSEIFTLVPNGTPDASHTFDLDNVAVGRNTIEVSTTTSTPESYSVDTSNNGAVNMLEFFKTDRKPYAIYTATIPTFNVIQGITNQIPTTVLTTVHGRSISVFTLSQRLKDMGVTVKVMPHIGTDEKPSFNVVSGLVNTVYWSNAQSIGGEKIHFNMHLFDKNGNYFNKLYTSVTIVSSQSTNNVFVIDDSKIDQQSVSEKFTAQEWKDSNNNNNVIDASNQ